MAFQTPITIRDAVDHIRRNEYLLPAIQREFVWKPEQIVMLFDSLMRGYPIGSFLFWDVDEEHCRQYQFYRFLRDYHERDSRHNPVADVSGQHGVTAILDGQQRLTSLAIGLAGSYAWKLRYHRWSNERAFPKRRLYLNLLSHGHDEDVDLKYGFRFLTQDEATERDEQTYWFRVGEVLNFSDLKGVFQFLRGEDLLLSEYPQDVLTNLFEVLCKNRLINYYREVDQDPDKVLNIFIRVNSGGTKLSYSDLLLSIATAQWTERDARTEIHDLVDELNFTGEGFEFDKDFVLKSSLVLADIGDVGFKVKNFTRDNMAKIEAAWPRIAAALRMAVSLTSRFGYSGGTLTANNALIPIAYYLYRREVPESYLESHAYADDQVRVRDWLRRSLLKRGIYGSGLDTTLRTARSTIRDRHDPFPFHELDAAFAKIGKGIRFSEEEIEELLEERWGRARAFSVLALLYPHVDFNNRFHEDHIYPRARFSRKRLTEAGVPRERIDDFRERVDCIPNLQLLEGVPNQEKSSRMPHEWLNEHYPTEEKRAAWRERNYVENLPEDMTSFLDFYETRRRLMRERLISVLGVRAPHDG